MPIYVFECPKCHNAEEQFRHAREVGCCAPVCPECGEGMQRSFQAEFGGRRRRPAGYPIYSDALAVHPDQIADAERVAAERGVPTKFVKRDCPEKGIFAGQAIIESREHQKQHCQKVQRGNVVNKDDTWSGRP